MSGIKNKNFHWVISFFVIFFFFSFPSSISFAEDKANILSFGANTEGKTDQTEFIQSAIDYQSDQGGGIVFFPKGIYLIDAVTSIVLKDNITLEFERGAILQVIPNSEENYQVLRVHDVSHIKIIGYPKIIGERNQHMGTTGEWGMGISIRGATNVVVENAEISNCWGDGIYIGSTINQNFNENILIRNPLLDNNRRQGISVISAKNLEIIDAKIYRTNGTNPQSAITIEPNNNLEHLEDISIINLISSENARYGIQIYLKYFAGSENLANIFIDNVKNVKDPEGVGIKLIENVKGKIVVSGYYYLSGNEILSKPIVNITTNTTTSITGIAPASSLIVIKAGTTVIGNSRSTNTGEYTVSIPRQKVGTVLSITATDKSRNISKETKITVKAEKFSDVQLKHWFYDEVLFLSEKKIVGGFLNGSFQPNKKTTRAEAAKMLATALNISSPDKKTEYSDIKSNHWARNDIAAVTEAGLFNGYTNGSFKPDKNITRAEMAQVLALAYKFKANSTQVFKDVPTSHWASKPISGLVQNKITYGYSDKTFRPGQAITRAEFSVFLARALNKDFR